MKRNATTLSLSLVLLVSLVLGLAPSGWMQETDADKAARPAVAPGTQAISSAGGMPGRPAPAKPIPHHEPGQPSRAGSYRTEVQQANELGLMETVQISGADAMAADGVDPLAENYTLVSLDTVLCSSSQGDQLNLKTLKVDVPEATSPPYAIETIPGSEKSVAAYPFHDIAATDLNNDGQTEQIAAWIGESNRIFMSVGEMPGSLGRTTSKPAAVVHADGSMDLLVRGYDEALWHRHYDGSNWGQWNNAAAGFLLSAPAIASQGDGSFDVFVIGSDNQTYQRHWDGSSWPSQWTKVAELDDWTALDFWFGPTPELAAPAAVARAGGIDLFRLGPDNTLRWCHSDGVTWGAWQNLGGMLASEPGAASLNANHMQVFARGVDETLWHCTYSGSWGAWQRAELDGLDPDVTIASAPSVFVSGGLTDVYVQGSDNQLWKTQCDGSGCGYWSLLGSPDSLASGVAVAAGNWKYIVQVKTGGLEYSSDGSTWLEFDGLTPWHLSYDTGLTAQSWALGGWQDFSVRVEPGYFWGDGRSQVALAYFSTPNRVSIAIYESAERFLPQLAIQLTLPQDIHFFAMTTGDFLDGDGTDEIALAYTRGNTYNLEVIEVTRQGLTVTLEGEVETVKIPDEDGDDYENGSFTGTFDITSGDFDADGQDEIGLISVWNRTDWIYGRDCPSYLYSMRMCVYDVLKNVAKAEFRLETYYVGTDRWGNKGAWWEEALQRGSQSLVGLAIAAGDVDGDGKDELVRTWPREFSIESDIYCLGAWVDIRVGDRFVRKLEVLELPGNTDKYTNSWDANNDGIISSPEIVWVDEAWWTNSYQDRLAVGDLNRDLKNEIVWLMSDQLRTYYHDPYADEDPPQFYKRFTADKSLASMRYPKLVTGNFTREGIRVGPPSYRVQNRVDTLVAVINMPPKHQDLIQDAQGNYQLIESPPGDCDPSPDSPNCTHAKYAKLDFQSSEQTVQTVHAYEISAGLEGEYCAGCGFKGIAQVKSCARYSINATHGGNFEKSTDDIASAAFRRKVIAASDDKVIYFGTPYGVWEYPVLSEASGETPEDVFITVAFPLVTVTQYPDTSGGYYCGTCEETWFSAGHQPNNVWSYDPIGDIRFADYNPEYEPAYDAFEGDWAEGEITYSKLHSVFDSVTFKHSISARVETEVTVEAKLKVVDLSGSFKTHLQGDYSYSSMQTDKLTTQEDTTFSYFFAPQPDSAKFTTRVLFYRGKDDSQIMNYQVEPGRSAIWQLYNKPDPAFILPWYGFPDPQDPQVPPCGEEKKLFSPDVVIDPPYVAPGEAVTITATLRNFSNVPTGNVLVRFYQGDPANNVVIGQGIVPSLSREAGPKALSIRWPATGVGRQKIFAVIDPEDSIAEMHDGADLIDNNVAYGLVQLSGAAYVDMAQAAEQPYDAISYTLGVSTSTVSLRVPRASLSAVTRFEVGGAEIAVPTEELAGHMAFEVEAFQGSKYTLWNEPIQNFDLKPGASDPPAVITLAYTDADIAGLIEANLTLYRFDGHKWEAATCPGYQITRFLDDNLIAVPVCKTGVFALSDKLPPAGENAVFLPLVLKHDGVAPQDGPDLVGSFRLSPDRQTFSAGEPVRIDVHVTNQGNISASPFWVDFYINPTAAPTSANVRWDSVCGQTPCLGLAWYVPAPLAAGQSVDLSSTVGSYSPEQSYWPGYFVNGTSDLYLYVDSWKPGIGLGAVVERNEANNRAERHGLVVTGPNPAALDDSPPSGLQPRAGE